MAATSILCLLVPLPLCALVLFHQKMYKETTAVTDQFIPELLLTHPLDIPHWTLKEMNIENQIVLYLALPYYALSIIKLNFFYCNVQGKARQWVRTAWVVYTSVWSVLIVGWLIVVLMWIVLGAVLNPVAVLAHRYEDSLVVFGMNVDLIFLFLFLGGLMYAGGLLFYRVSLSQCCGRQ